MIPILQSCRENKLVKIAKTELQSAIESNLKEYYAVVDSVSVRDIKTVYDNDSICILQCITTGKDTAGTVQEIEYRYTFLIDMIASRIEGKAIFNERAEICLCMPDSLIKKSREESERSGENVYDALYGSTLPISIRKR
jgi:hypothetical protein